MFLHSQHVFPSIRGWIPWFGHFEMYSKRWNIIFFLGNEFALSYQGIVIFMKFPQQPKTKSQLGRLSGD